MKRDMDLARKILFEIEKLPFKPGWQQIEVEGYSDDEVAYHVYLLHDAGLIDAIESSSMLKSVWHPVRIRWHGQEFLSAARDNKRWQKAKAIAEKAGGVALPVLMQLLTSYAKAELGLP